MKHIQHVPDIQQRGPSKKPGAIGKILNCKMDLKNIQKTLILETPPKKPLQRKREVVGGMNISLGLETL